MFGYNPTPKPSHKRRTPKRVNRGKFSAETIKHIFERDEWRCVRCGASRDLESVPHHIRFKSQGGLGTKDNGATVCRSCHRLAHKERAVREWFEDYRVKVLIPYYEKEGA
jgi:hypothetical protein